MVKDKRKFLTRYRTKEEVDKRAYWESKRMVKKVVAKAKEDGRCAFIDDLDLQCKKGTIFKMIQQMVSTNKDVIGSGRVRNAGGTIIRDEKEKQKIWKEYYEKLLNEKFE